MNKKLFRFALIILSSLLILCACSNPWAPPAGSSAPKSIPIPTPVPIPTPDIEALLEDVGIPPAPSFFDKSSAASVIDSFSAPDSDSDSSPTSDNPSASSAFTTETVYVTKSGEKYHNDGCRYLKKSCIPIDLADAVAKGYTPCSKCGPPRMESESSSAGNYYEPPQNYKAPSEEHKTSVTVYVTRTGKKYHRGGCQYLRKSCIPIDLDKAIKKGYAPCSRCGPPR